MLAAAVGRVEERDRRRIGPAERPVVPDIAPQPRDLRLLLGQHRHRGVVAVQALGREDVGPDLQHQRHQAGGRRTYPVRQRGDVELDPFAGVDRTLPGERQMLAVLRGQHQGQQVRPGPAAGDRVRGGRRLADRLAAAAADLLPHVLDHLPAPRLALEALGDVLAQLAHRAAALRAGCRVPGRRSARAAGSPAAAGGPACGWCRLTAEARFRRCRDLGRRLLFGHTLLELGELQLELLDELGPALGRAGRTARGAPWRAAASGARSPAGGCDTSASALGARSRASASSRAARSARIIACAAARSLGRGSRLFTQTVQAHSCRLVGLNQPARVTLPQLSRRPVSGRQLRCGWHPVDPFREIAELGGCDRHHTLGRRRPDEPAPLQPLDEQAHALGIMPQDLDQIARTHVIPHMNRYSRRSPIGGIRFLASGFVCAKVHVAGAPTLSWSRINQDDCASCHAGCATRWPVLAWIRVRRASRSKPW